MIRYTNSSVHYHLIYYNKIMEFQIERAFPLQKMNKISIGNLVSMLFSSNNYYYLQHNQMLNPW